MTRQTLSYSPCTISNFDQYGNSSFQVFLQSDQAEWDNSAQKLKTTNNLAVFDHFGSVKYNIFAPWTPTRDLPCTLPPDPSWIRE